MKALVTIMLFAVAVSVAPRSGAAPDGPDGYAGRVRFDQHLNAAVPGQMRFQDESGREVRLQDFLGIAPVGLVFSYYRCTNLCPTVIRNLADRLAQGSAGPGRDLRVVVVSIDPSDSPASAAQAKLKDLDRVPLGERDARWHFLTAKAADVGELARTVGFRYAYDSTSHQYAHPAGFALLTPDGRISRYFFGFDYSAEQLADAIGQASARRIASPIDRLLLVCFHYDPLTGRYSATILTALRGMAVAMLIAAVPIGWLLRRRAVRLVSMGR